MKVNLHIGLWLVAEICLMLTGCEHKDLCYHHVHGHPVLVPVDWRYFQEETPTGVTILAYPKENSQMNSFSSHDITAPKAYLREGNYRLIVFNQSELAFGSFRFQGLGKYETAAVESVESADKGWYQKSQEEIVVVNPEWFATGVCEDLHVAPTELQPENLDDYEFDAQIQVSDTVFPVSRVQMVNVIVHVTGIENLYSIRGSLNGLSGGCRMATGKPLNTRVTYLLEHWTKSTEERQLSSEEKEETGEEGILMCQFPCFGLPEDHISDRLQNHLKISILLVDGKTVKDFDFKVGDRFEVEDGVHLRLKLEVGTEQDGGSILLPDVINSTGGFDVEVDEWGDVHEIEVPM